MVSTYLPHVILFDLITLHQYKSWSFSLCISLHSPPRFRVQIFSSAPWIRLSALGSVECWGFRRNFHLPSSGLMSLGKVLSALIQPLYFRWGPVPKAEATNSSPATGTWRLLCSLIQHRQERLYVAGRHKTRREASFVLLSVSMSGCKGSECAHRGFQIFQVSNKMVHWRKEVLQWWI
jgi:hypothetical protein